MVVVDVDANVAWLSLTWTVTWRRCREVVVGDVVDGDVIVVDVVVGNVVDCYYNVAWLSMTWWTLTYLSVTWLSGTWWTVMCASSGATEVRCDGAGWRWGFLDSG